MSTRSPRRPPGGDGTKLESTGHHSPDRPRSDDFEEGHCSSFTVVVVQRAMNDRRRRLARWEERAENTQELREWFKVLFPGGVPGALVGLAAGVGGVWTLVQALT